MELQIDGRQIMIGNKKLLILLITMIIGFVFELSSHIDLYAYDCTVDTSSESCSIHNYNLPNDSPLDSYLFHKKGSTISMAEFGGSQDSYYTFPKDGYYSFLLSHYNNSLYCTGDLPECISQIFNCDPNTALHGKWKYFDEISFDNSDTSEECQKDDTLSFSVFKVDECDIKINVLIASPSIFTAGSGNTTFTGSISSNSPVSWTLTVAGKSFTGTDSSVSVTWDGKNSAGNIVAPGTYTATLTATSNDDPTCSTTKSIDISIVATCDLQINNFNAVNEVLDRNGFVNFTGEIISSKPFSWTVTINGTNIGSGTSANVSASWSLKDQDFKQSEAKQFTAMLSVTSDSDKLCKDSKSTNFKVTAREKDCKLEITANSSINIASGNLSHSQNLFTVPNSGLMSDFTLHYNSTNGYSGVLGTGWTHTYNIFISTDSTDDTYILSDGRGGMISLYKNGDYYASDISAYPLLQVNADSTFTLTYKNGTVYNFDTNGKLTAMTDKNGNAVKLSYSSSGNLVNITDPAGKVIYLSYNGNNRISAITDPNNNSYAFTYSGDTLTAVSSHNSLGTQIWQYTYDSKAFMLTKTDPQGNLVQYSYDAEHRVRQTIDPQGNVRNIQYDPENSTTTVTEKDGGVWVYRYDPVLGALKSKTDPVGGTISYEYDDNRNLTGKIESDGTATTYTYDDSGNMTSVTDALGNTTTYTYNEQKLVTSIIDSAGRQTLYIYDAKGNILSTTDPVGATTQYTYDSKGNITSITAPNGGTTTMAYDASNNLISVTDPGGQTTTQTYDNLGNMISQTDAAGNTTTFQYNSLNQLIAVTDPTGNTTKYTYDANGNRLSATDANGNTTTYDYNYKNQLIQTTDAAGFTTTFTYGSGGCFSCGGGADKLKSVTDAKNQTTTYQYDQVGRLIKEIDPLGNFTSYAYDAKGNMITKIKPDGHIITYIYDDLNRLLQRIYLDNTSDLFQYDQAGNMTAATNQNVAYYYSYDAANRVTDVTSYNLAQIFNVGYQYDIMGSRTAMTLAEGTATPRTINYYYNVGNQITKITSETGTYTFAYDSLGRRIKRTLPNDSYTTYTYDPLSRLTAITHINAFKQTIDTFSYTYDNVGNRLTKKDADKTIGYTYDQVSRLTKAAPSGRNKLGKLLENIVNHHTEAYSYDPVGNRQTGPKATDGYTYDAANELLTSQGRVIFNRDNQYQYDLNGNLVKKTQSIEGNIKLITSYTYDDENRLIDVTIQRGDKIREISFAYDPFGRRISRTVQQEDLDEDNNIIDKLLDKQFYPRTTFYIYDEQNIIAEYDDNRKLIASYVHGPNIDEPLSAETRNTRIYYHTDGVDSITTLTNHMGHKVQEYDYDSFGNIKSTPFWIKQPYTYTGREFDYHTGLYYYRARYYDPKAGRFVTRDPIGFEGGDVNLYNYVGANPVNWVDPFGLYNKDVHFNDTYNIAIRVGLSQNTAYKIATADNNVDTKYPVRSYENRKNWHLINVTRVNSLFDGAIASCSAETFGEALHALQDYYSHTLQGYGPRRGHWTHAPDIPSNNLGLYSRMINSTTNAMQQFKDKCPCLK
jgi:RHS repeat-associated protein